METGQRPRDAVTMEMTQSGESGLDDSAWRQSKVPGCSAISRTLATSFFPGYTAPIQGCPVILLFYQGFAGSLSWGPCSLKFCHKSYALFVNQFSRLSGLELSLRLCMPMCIPIQQGWSKYASDSDRSISESFIYAKCSLLESFERT